MQTFVLGFLVDACVVSLSTFEIHREYSLTELWTGKKTAQP
jgi:hypothetical protein